MIFKPRIYQASDIIRYAETDHHALLYEMGAGKTLTEIHLAIEQSKTAKANLIFSNKGSYANWTKEGGELSKHCYVPYLAFTWDGDKLAKTMKLFTQWLPLAKQFDGTIFFVANIECLVSDKACDVIEQYCESFGKVRIVCDESSTIKSFKALRTKRIKYFRKKYASIAGIMTGTPIQKSPLDLWSQYDFLNPWKHPLGFNSYYAFKARYAVTVQLGGQGGPKFEKITGYKNIEELQRSVDSCSTRVTKKDCLDLPEKTYGVHYVGLSSDQKIALKELQLNWSVTVGGEVVSVTAITTAIIRAQQILSGFLPNSEGELCDIPSERIEGLLEILEDYEGKAIVWCKFREDIRKVSEALRKQYGEQSTVTYFGDTCNADRVEAIRRMAEDTDTRFFVSNKTGAFGIEILSATLHVFYVNDYDYSVRYQQEDRSHRMGQKNVVHYVDIVAKGTLDERVLKILQEKKGIADLVLDTREIMKFFDVT